jgi:ATP-binding cassette subfamily F protein uup
LEATAPPPPPPRVKLSYKDQRDFELLPKRIEELEADIVRDEALLADPALYTKDFAKFERLTKAVEAARAEKDAAEMRWLELAEMVEGVA